MGFPRATEIAQLLVKKRLHPGDRAVDATVGNGHDTLFLASCVGPAGRVDGFDIQEAAIAGTTLRIGADQPVALHLRGHEEMASVVPTGVKAVMFNLGYYPSGERNVITQPDTTLRALEAALGLLVPEGIVTVVIYPGHPGGAEEADRIKAWLAGLPPERYRTVHYGLQGRPGGPPPPYLLAIEQAQPRQSKNASYLGVTIQREWD